MRVMHPEENLSVGNRSKMRYTHNMIVNRFFLPKDIISMSIGYFTLTYEKFYVDTSGYRCTKGYLKLWSSIIIDSIYK